MSHKCNLLRDDAIRAIRLFYNNPSKCLGQTAMLVFADKSVLTINWEDETLREFYSKRIDPITTFIFDERTQNSFEEFIEYEGLHCKKNEGANWDVYVSPKGGSEVLLGTIKGVSAGGIFVLNAATPNPFRIKNIKFKKYISGLQMAIFAATAAPPDPEFTEEELRVYHEARSEIEGDFE